MIVNGELAIYQTRRVLENIPSDLEVSFLSSTARVNETNFTQHTRPLNTVAQTHKFLCLCLCLILHLHIHIHQKIKFTCVHNYVRVHISCIWMYLDMSHCLILSCGWMLNQISENYACRHILFDFIRHVRTLKFLERHESCFPKSNSRYMWSNLSSMLLNSSQVWSLGVFRVCA